MSTTSTSSSIETLVLTDAATAKVGELLEEGGQPGTVPARRRAARGCSGFSYEMFFDTDAGGRRPAVSDRRVKVVVDPASATLLTGSTLDYKDGLQGAGFSINNPNATRTCGCGQSFS